MKTQQQDRRYTGGKGLVCFALGRSTCHMNMWTRNYGRWTKGWTVCGVIGLALMLVNTATAQDYQCRVRFHNSVGMITNNGDFRCDLRQVRSSDKRILTVTNCTMQIQSVVSPQADPQLRNHFPPSVTLTGTQGALSDIEGRTIVYQSNAGDWRRQSDSTETNKLLGPLSVFTDMIITKSNEWRRSMLGADVVIQEEVVLRNAGLYDLRRIQLGGLGNQIIFETSVIYTQTNEKIYSEVVLTNAGPNGIMSSLECVVQRAEFTNSPGAILVGQ